jgi:hypothetical protein
MLKALDRLTGEEYIILHPRWIQDLKYLKSLDQQDILICQGCEQPVRVRAGQFRQWHFAHKHLENCPYANESPALMNARAVLYRWLVTKFGDDVTLEKQVAQHLPRHVDCWVERDGKIFSYWIFDTRISPDIRESISQTLPKLTTYCNWLFLTDLLRIDADEDDCVHLTTTEREFRQSSVYDGPASNSFSKPGQTLHYLNTDQEELTTIRNLLLVHRPQMFRGCFQSHPLFEMRVSAATGEFVHPGEHEKLPLYLEAKKLAEKVKEKPGSIAGYKPLRQPAPTPLPAEEGICIFCGKKTRDWWSFDGTTKTCKCWDCYRQGQA